MNTPSPHHPPSIRPAPRMPRRSRRAAPGSTLGSSLTARLRTELRDLTLDTSPETVRAALAAAGLHLQLDAVRTWLRTLNTRKDTP